MDDQESDSDRPSEPPEPDTTGDSIRQGQGRFSDPFASISALHRAMAPSRKLAELAKPPRAIQDLEKLSKRINSPTVDTTAAHRAANALIGPTLDATKLQRRMSKTLEGVIGPSAKQAMGIGKTMERVVGPMAAKEALGIGKTVREAMGASAAQEAMRGLDERRKILSGLNDQLSLAKISSSVIASSPAEDHLPPHATATLLRSLTQLERLWPTPDDVAKIVEAEPTESDAELTEITEEQKQTTIAAFTAEMTMIRDRTLTMSSIELASLAEAPAEVVRKELGVTLLPDASISKALTQLAAVAQDRELNAPRDKRDLFRTRLLVGMFVIAIINGLIAYEALRGRAPVVEESARAPMILEEPPELQLDMPDPLSR